MLRIAYLFQIPSRPRAMTPAVRAAKPVRTHSVRRAEAQHMQGGAAFAAVVAAALHGRGQLVGPAEGADEQRHQDRHQGLGPLEDIAGFKVRAPGLLGGHDLVRLLDEGGDKAQGDGHHHGQLVDGQTQLLQRRQQALQSVRQGRWGWWCRSAGRCP